MAQHLSREQMTRYRARALAPSEVVGVDAHLGECSDCRAAMAGLGLISAVETARGEHLSYEQLDAWVEEQLDSSERELVMAHVALCDACARQLRAYESYAPAMSAPVPVAAGWGERVRAFFRGPRLAVIATAALAVLVLSPLVMRQTGHSGLLASLYGPARPAALNDLPANPDSTLVYPVSEAIEERQPILRWQTTGSEAVEISILDATGKEIAKSGEISGAEWLDPVPLNRGARYTWEVRTAIAGGGTRRGSFRVLSDADHEKLEAARASGAAPVTMGEMAREMGALSEAQRDFRAAVAADPKDEKARKLLDQVRAMQGHDQ